MAIYVSTAFRTLLAYACFFKALTVTEAGLLGGSEYFPPLVFYIGALFWLYCAVTVLWKGAK